MNKHSLTPPTNRGADKSNEYYLSACIDWFQMTVKGESIKTICEDILGIPTNLMLRDWRAGIKGCRAKVSYDNIRILEPGGNQSADWLVVLMTGKACRNFEVFLQGQEISWLGFFERCLKYNINIPRLDIAIDDKKTYFTIDELNQKRLRGEVVSKFITSDHSDSIKLKDGTMQGETIYFGSRSSSIYFTFYEKHFEQAKKFGIDVGEPWNRYELRFKQDKAIQAIKEMIKNQNVYQTALKVLNYYLRFVTHNRKDNRNRLPTWKPWQDFIGDVGQLRLSVQPEPQDFLAKLLWLQSHIAPSLKVVRQVDEKSGTNFLGRIIDNARIGQKHHEMINQFEAQASDGYEMIYSLLDQQK